MKPATREQLRDRIDEIERELHSEWAREPAPEVEQLRSTEPEVIRLPKVPLWDWLFGMTA